MNAGEGKEESEGDMGHAHAGGERDATHPLLNVAAEKFGITNKKIHYIYI